MLGEALWPNLYDKHKGHNPLAAMSDEKRGWNVGGTWLARGFKRIVLDQKPGCSKQSVACVHALEHAVVCSLLLQL